MRESSATGLVERAHGGSLIVMRPVGEDLAIYLHRATVDMRRGRNGLAAIVRETMRLEVVSGARSRAIP